MATILDYLQLCIRLTQIVAASQHALGMSQIPRASTKWRIHKRPMSAQISLALAPIPFIRKLSQSTRQHTEPGSAPEHQLSAFIQGPDQLRVDSIPSSLTDGSGAFQPEMVIAHTTCTDKCTEPVDHQDMCLSNELDQNFGSANKHTSQNESPWLLIDPGPSIFALLQGYQWPGKGNRGDHIASTSDHSTLSPLISGLPSTATYVKRPAPEDVNVARKRSRGTDVASRMGQLHLG